MKKPEVLLVYEDAHCYKRLRAKSFPNKEAALKFTQSDDFCPEGESANFLIVEGGDFDWEEDSVDLT